MIGTKRGSVQTEPLIQRQNKEQRYTTLFRNGRPAPQNDGVQSLPEVEGSGVRPKYTTITRTQAPKVAGEEVEVDEEEDVAGHDDDTDEIRNHEKIIAGHVQEAGEPIKTPTYQYVNIKRARPSTAAPEEHDESDDEISDDETTDVNISPVTAATPPRMHYVNIQRIRPTKPQYYAEYFDSTSLAPASSAVPSSSAAPESK